MPPPTPAVQFYSHTAQMSNHQKQSSPSRSNGQGTENFQLHHTNYKNFPQSIQHAEQAKPITAPTHQYPHLQQNQQLQLHPSFTSNSQSSSASSLSSMTAALIAGAGPNLLYNNHYAQHQHMQRVASQTSVGSTPPIESPISPAAMIGLGYENLLLPPPSGPFDGGSIPTPVPSSHTPTNNNPHQMLQHHPNIVPQQQLHHLPPNVATSLLPQAGLTSQQMHQQQLLYATAAAHAATIANRPVESQEKRVKRLERNRESARKSRRRKKERLATLGEMVNMLQNKIATERRHHIDAMVPALRSCRSQELAKRLENSSDMGGLEQKDSLVGIIRGSGPSSPIMRSVLDFQYTTLKQMTLPSYQKLLLWFTLCDESYFLAGKEQYASQQEQQTVDSLGGTASAIAANQAKPWTKVSSKQIGDEMLNGPGGSKANLSRDTKNKRQNHDDGNDDNTRNIMANVYDAARCWPLFCFELKFSVDQEERFLATYRQLVTNEDTGCVLAERRSQMAAAVHTTESLGKVVGSLGHIVAQREDRSYLSILDTNQVSKYQAWIEQNRERLRALPTATQSSVNNSIKVSLEDICFRLNQVLQISTTTQMVFSEIKDEDN